LGLRLKLASDEKSEALHAIDLLKDFHDWLPKAFKVTFLGDGKYFHVYLLNQISELSWTYIIRARRSGKLGKECESERAENLNDEKGYGIQYIVNATGVTKVHVRAIIGRRGDQVHAFVTNLAKDSVFEILKYYRRRFRIENAFRSVRQFFI
jgi:IS4 transposase